MDSSVASYIKLKQWRSISTCPIIILKLKVVFLLFVGMFCLLFFLPSCFTDLGH